MIRTHGIRVNDGAGELVSKCAQKKPASIGLSVSQQADKPRLLSAGRRV
jgi:hypothetical protein